MGSSMTKNTASYYFHQLSENKKIAFNLVVRTFKDHIQLLHDILVQFSSIHQVRQGYKNCPLQVGTQNNDPVKIELPELCYFLSLTYNIFVFICGYIVLIFGTILKFLIINH